MNRISFLIVLTLAGCLETQNRKVEMKSNFSGISSVNSRIWIETNPKTLEELEMEYFNNHSIFWPNKMPESRCQEKIWKDSQEKWKDSERALGESY